MALDFDGTDDQVSYGDINAIDGAVELTIMCWHIFDAFAANTEPLGKVGTLSWQALSTDNKFYQTFSGGTGTAATSAIFAALDLKHLASVYNGAGATDALKVQVYVNAVAETLTFGGTIPASLAATAAIFEVGGVAGLFGNQKVSHLKVWLAALTAAEVAAEMRSYLPVRTRNLLLWSPFDDGIGARDYSGNANHGTLVSAPIQAEGPSGINYGSRVLIPRPSLRTVPRRGNFPRLASMVPYYPWGV